MCVPNRVTIVRTSIYDFLLLMNQARRIFLKLRLEAQLSCIDTLLVSVLKNQYRTLIGSKESIRHSNRF